MVSSNSFTGKNISAASSDFTPAEDLEKTNSNETNWQDRSSMKSQEMSFGQVFQGSNNIRDVFGNKSPPKRRDRVALVELSNRESPAENRLGMSRLQDFISECETLNRCYQK